MEWVVVERDFDWELTSESVRMLADAGACLELYGVEAVRSYLAPGGKRMVCVFRAPDAQAVRTVLRALGSPPGTVWTSIQHTS